MLFESKKSSLRSFSRVDLLLLLIFYTVVTNTPCLGERSLGCPVAIPCLPFREAVCSTRVAFLREQACRLRRRRMKGFSR